MFEGATSFNQNIIWWNMQNVTDMSYMFKDATSFNNNLNWWKVSANSDKTDMFEGSGMIHCHHGIVPDHYSTIITYMPPYPLYAQNQHLTKHTFLNKAITDMIIHDTTQ